MTPSSSRCPTPTMPTPLRFAISRRGTAKPKDLQLHFDRPRQRFTPAAVEPAPADKGKLQSALAALWDRTAPARDDDQGDGR